MEGVERRIPIDEAFSSSWMKCSEYESVVSLSPEVRCLRRAHVSVGVSAEEKRGESDGKVALIWSSGSGGWGRTGQKLAKFPTDSKLDRNDVTANGLCRVDCSERSRYWTLSGPNFKFAADLFFVHCFFLFCFFLHKETTWFRWERLDISERSTGMNSKKG